MAGENVTQFLDKPNSRCKTIWSERFSKSENELPLLWHMSDCFDFQQEFFADSSSYFYQRACRGIGGGHIAITDLAKDGVLEDIHHVDIQLDHVGEIRSNRSKRDL